MTEKLNTNDYRLIAICILVSMGSLFIVQNYFRAAFPDASIEFKITKQESRQKAEQFLRNRGWDVSGHKHAAKFDHIDGKTFLEKQLDAREAGKIFNEINGWQWQNRWFRPLKKEEYRVDFSTSGNLAFFEHKISEDTAGDTLSQEVALGIAQFYLGGILDWDPEKWELVDSKTEKQKNRYDHEFTWKEIGFDVDGSTHRITVRVRGDEVGYYKEWLKVPETWQREYENLTSKNLNTALVGIVFYVITMLAMFITILLRIRKKDVRWKTAFTYGAAATVLLILNAINEIPLREFNFDTTGSYMAFILDTFLYEALLGPLLFGSWIALLIAAAETLYRDHYPGQIAFRNILSAQGLRSKSFFNSAIIGIMLTFLFLAFQTIFYLVSNRLGGWSPTQVPDINRLGTALPWVAVLLGGLTPALTEESISRMFTIPFLQKYVKSTFLAVLISSVIWGLSHASYPAQPFYIRVVEVSIGGIFIGYIFLRYGILATLIWHFSVDAVYSALILFQSDNPYFLATAVVTSGLVSIPLIYSIVSYGRKGGFAKSDALVNALDIEIIPEKKEEVKRVERAQIKVAYKPLSKRRKRLGIAMATVALILWFIPFKTELEDLTRINVTRSEAVDIANKYLEGFNVDLTGYERATEIRRYDDSPVTSSVFNVRIGVTEFHEHDSRYAPHYLSEEGGREAVRKVFTSHLIPYEWRIRFIKGMEKGEFNVFLDSRDGQVVGHEFLVADTTYLPSITLDSASVLAKSYLFDYGYDLEDFEFVESQTIEKENRTDYRFKLEATDQSPDNVGESRNVYHITVAGDQVNVFRRDIKLPEEWKRDYEKGTVLSNLQRFYTPALILLFGALWIVALTKLLKLNQPTWKPIILGSLCFTLLLLISLVNSSQDVLIGYLTSWSMSNYILLYVSASIIFTLFVTFILFVLILSVRLMYPDAFLAFTRQNRKFYLNDALLSSFVTLGLFLFLEPVQRLLMLLRPSWIPSGTFSIIPISGFLPGLDLLSSIISDAVFWVFILIGIQYIYRHYLAHKPFGAIMMVLPFIVFFGIGSEIYYVASVPQFIMNCLWFGFFLYLLRYFWLGNPWSYLLGILIMFNFDDVNGYMEVASHPTYQLQGWIVIGLILLGFVYLAWEAWHTKRELETIQ